MERLHNIAISEFMIKDVHHLKKGQKMWEAYHMMKNHHIRHLPVVDENDALIGVFSETDLNHAYSPRITDAGWYYDQDELNALDPVRFMTDDPAKLSPDDTLKKACEVMVRNKYGCIPITGNDGKLVGIVTNVDLLKKIASLFE